MQIILPLSDYFLKINSLKFNSRVKAMMISKNRIIRSEVVNIFNALGVMVDFMCQPDWAKGCPD